MILLVTHGQPTMERFNDPHLGRLIQPRHYSSIRRTAESGMRWAADNDAFNGWSSEAEGRFVQMLDAIEGLPGCLFVTAPDVVGNALATAKLFAKWEAEIRGRGLPIALVAQDGFDQFDPIPGHYATQEAEREAWDAFDALFIGGSTEFKLGEYARELVAEAKRQGKWVHMGRVNSLRRISYAASIGCDSLDGTKYARFPDTYIAQGLRDMRGGRQTRLAA